MSRISYYVYYTTIIYFTRKNSAKSFSRIGQTPKRQNEELRDVGNHDNQSDVRDGSKNFCQVFFQNRRFSAILDCDVRSHVTA